MKNDITLFERVEHFEYLRKNLKYQNSVPEETKIEVRECLLSFGAESLVFQCDIQKYKD